MPHEGVIEAWIFQVTEGVCFKETHGWMKRSLTAVE